MSHRHLWPDTKKVAEAGPEVEGVSTWTEVPVLPRAGMEEAEEVLRKALHYWEAEVEVEAEAEQKVLGLLTVEAAVVVLGVQGSRLAVEEEALVEQDSSSLVVEGVREGLGWKMKAEEVEELAEEQHCSLSLLLGAAAVVSRAQDWQPRTVWIVVSAEPF